MFYAKLEHLRLYPLSRYRIALTPMRKPAINIAVPATNSATTKVVMSSVVLGDVQFLRKHSQIGSLARLNFRQRGEN